MILLSLEVSRREVQTSQKLSPKKRRSLPWDARKTSAVLTARGGGFLFSREFTLCRHLPWQDLLPRQNSQELPGK